MGLNDEEVVVSRKNNGSNEITKTNKRTFFSMVIESLGDPIIKILLIALGIKLVFLIKSFDIFETIGILIAVLLATLISSLSEYGSEAAFSKLQDDSEKLKTKVYRNNKLIEVFSSEIVVGDVILLSSGDKLPADGYLIDGNLSIDESSINGESKESKKIAFDKVNLKGENKVYKGTTVYNGSAKVLITLVGDNTLYGKISKELDEKNSDSPLKIRLFYLAKKISVMGYLGAFLATLSYLFMNIVVYNDYNISLIISDLTNVSLMIDYAIYSLTLCVTIIVLAVPEGLPVMITLVLSSNMKKMIKDNVLVRKMVGIETAGSLNLLLTDKTGTLTKGILTVTQISTYDNYIVNDFDFISNIDFKNNLFHSLYTNNECVITDKKIIGGNSTDKALISFVGAYFLKVKVLKKTPFNSSDKFSNTQITENGESITYLKGAPEVIIPKCSKYLDRNANVKPITSKRYIYKTLKDYTNSGSRVIALAKKNEDESYTYIGLVSIKDELRSVSKEGVSRISSAGIDIIMITGDSIDTARVIAREVGILKSQSDLVISSDEFNNLSDDEVIYKLNNIKVIARALPIDKSRLVRLAQEKKLVVGMTGDGVNDAPALKKSDVGFVMGSGTEVAKEAGDIVILDDNINSIATAILYGRTIFKNIRKFIIYQLSINVSALIISIVGTIIGISEPITIMQMLWLNMIMDTFAGLAFSFEPALKEYMNEKPKNKDEDIMNNYMISQIICSSLCTSVICMLFLKLDIIKNFFNDPSNLILYTGYFALFIFLGIFNAFNARTHRINIFANLLKNKVFTLVFLFIFIAQIFIIYNGGQVFRTYGLEFKELMLVLSISLIVFPIDFIRKSILKSKGLNTGV
ncbi:MAG: calcium-translocating P-type ATPase, PMCA-type [bacterium]